VRGIRRGAAIVLSGFVVFAAFFGATAWADGSKPSVDQAASQFVAHINEERTSRGLAPLAVAGDMVAIAGQHSADMAAAGRIYHDPDIRSKVQNWQELGDNVGSGASVDNIHTGFMNSQIHRDEILGPDYTQVGVGCYWAGDVLYVTEIFRLPMTHAAPALAAPAGATQVQARVTRRPVVPAPVAPAAPSAAPRAPVPSTVPVTAPAPVPVPTTAAPRVTVLPWPPATALDARRVSRSSPTSHRLTAVALAAALLLMSVAGFQVHTLRRRA
jgi:hypothetical protein